MIRDFTGHAEERHKSPELVNLMLRLEQGEKLPSKELPSIHEGTIRRMGWLYDFRRFMTKYIVKTDYYLEECYGFNKTQVREHFKGLGRIHYIQEVKR